MRLLCCGDRNWIDKEFIYRYLEIFHNVLGYTVLIHGAARGADSIAAEEGAKLGYEIIPFPANWEKYGKAAGVIRNQQMLQEGKPDFVLGFHDNIEQSKGTKDMISRVKKIGVSYVVLSHSEGV